MSVMNHGALRKPSIPKLSLTPAEQHAVENEAAALLTQTLQIEHDFFVNDGVVDEQHWKHLKSSDNFSIYKERYTATESSQDDSTSWKSSDSFGPNMRSASIDSDDILSNKKNARVPLIVSTGHVEGSVEDVVFGFAAPDSQSWRFRSAYTKDQFADSKILATIHEPSEERPFNYLCIKWFVTMFPAILQIFVDPRDSLIIEACGVKVDEHGQRYGYHIIHSYEHPAIVSMEASGICRSSVSMCFIIREVRPGKVHVFSRGFVDPKGDMSPNVVVMFASKAVLTTAKTVEVSFAKKLVWLMAEQERERQDSRRRGRVDSSEMIDSEACVSCGKTPGFLNAKLATCRLCREKFCSKCTSQHRVVVDVTRKEVTERTFPFCVRCVFKAKQMSPHVVAVEKARQNANRVDSSASSSQRSASSTGLDSQRSLTSDPGLSDR
ncbi:hypothetical protein Poli38472_012597 [Pythium oligandrum]|uniref:FYVE-type domain-containing protein n=1 Tax=Pythium oligandrum TaxID=41045 RepID=A0A8K1CEJ2_PYTOL|nr:hypothetical protein Poli38472_012597 [Pythium oligandrum]|eukprot:TMW61406.1 hypothetical protein Poli38472_012597 [Pythium oligandrum]